MEEYEKKLYNANIVAMNNLAELEKCQRQRDALAEALKAIQSDGLVIDALSLAGLEYVFKNIQNALAMLDDGFPP